MTGKHRLGADSADAQIRADANNRAGRTLIQGLGIDVLAAIGVAIAEWLPDADLAASAAWGILGALVGKSILQAAAAWLMRMKLTALAPPPQQSAAAPPTTPPT